MYRFWCDYVKLKYREKAKKNYMDTGSFIVYIKTGDIYKEIADDVETRFDTSSYELESPLLKWKNKNAIGLMKDELDRKIMKGFVGLGAKAYSYLIDDCSENKKTPKSTKSCVMKRKLEDYKNWLEATQIEN